MPVNLSRSRTPRQDEADRSAGSASAWLPSGACTSRSPTSRRRRSSPTPGTSASATTTPPRCTGTARPSSASGAMLQQHPRDEFVISTKVGRLLYPLAEVLAHPELDRDFQRLGSVTGIGGETSGEELNDWYYRGVPDVRPVYDYSYDAIMRSVESSLKRTGLAPPRHPVDPRPGHPLGAGHRRRLSGPRRTAEPGRRVGDRRRHEPVRDAHPVRAEGDFDAFMLAGRYTLLDQRALDDLLPVCVKKNIAIVIAGVMNSGLLANPTPESHFDYGPASEAQEWLDKALRIKAVCERNGVPLAGGRPPVRLCPSGRRHRGRRGADDRSPRRHHREDAGRDPRCSLGRPAGRGPAAPGGADAEARQGMRGRAHGRHRRLPPPLLGHHEGRLRLLLDDRRPGRHQGRAGSGASAAAGSA